MTYRPRSAAPLLLRRAVNQTLRLEVWDDSALAGPTSGTISIWDASDALIVDAAAVTVIGGVATYTLSAATVPATLGYSAEWRAQWSLVFAGVTEVFDQPAGLVRNVFRAPIVPGDLVTRHSEFGPGRELDPAQESAGATIGAWIAEAEAWIEAELWRMGRRAELILDSWQLRDVVLAKTLAIAFTWAATFAQDGTRLAAQADRYAAEAEGALGRAQFRYDSAETGQPSDAPKIAAVSAYFLSSNRGSP